MKPENDKERSTKIERLIVRLIENTGKKHRERPEENTGREGMERQDGENNREEGEIHKGGGRDTQRKRGNKAQQSRDGVKPNVAPSSASKLLTEVQTEKG